MRGGGVQLFALFLQRLRFGFWPVLVLEFGGGDRADVQMLFLIMILVTGRIYNSQL